MGIKGGSGRGSVDKQGDRENVPGGVGSSRKRNRVPFPPPPPKKPIDRIKDDLFEQKPDFRLGYYVVEQEFDDYLVCHGFDPNSPKPASEITPDAYKTITVAKPWELQRTPWDDETVTEGGIAYTYTYSDDEYGVRTATWTDENGQEQSEEQRITPPYLITGVEIKITAAQMKKSAWVEGLETEDEDGTRIRWMDFNAAGRHWASQSSGTTSGSSDFPDTEECECGNCISGNTIVDGTECCDGSLTFPMTNPWLACSDTDLTLMYIGSDQWLTEAFDGPDCGGNQNSYRWRMDPDVDGTSTLTLVLETDNGCDDVCVTYWKSGFDCRCANEFTISKPNGKHIGVSRKDLACKVCINPQELLVTQSCAEEGPLPTLYKVTFTTACSPFGNIEYLQHYDAQPEPKFGSGEDYANCLIFYAKSCLWYTRSDDQSPSPLTKAVHSLAFRRESSTRWSVTYTISSTAPGVTQSSVCSELAVWVSAVDFDPLVGGVLTLGTSRGGSCEAGNDTITIFPVTDAVSPTDTGACADSSCTDTAAPTDPDAGCCCYVGEGFTHWDETLCDSFGGTWSSDCSATCSVEGACCTTDGRCVEINSVECGLISGTHVENGDCGAGACDDPTGACCRSATETCEITTEADCSGSDHYFGDDTTCSGKDCGIVACCHAIVGTTCSTNPDCTCTEDYFETQCADEVGISDAGNDCGIVVCNCGGGSTCIIPG